MAEEETPESLSALFEQASRMIHGMGHAGGLTSAQWVALRYFSEASPFNRTMASLARFQGLSVTPIGRTVRNLIERGYVERFPNPRSKRADLIILTDEGKRKLTEDPYRQLIGIMSKIPPGDRTATAKTIKTVLEEIKELSLPQFDEVALRASDSTECED